MRIPITRHDADGSVIDGTAEVEYTDVGWQLHDFRDLDGAPLVLPPGSSLHYVWSDDDLGPEETSNQAEDEDG